VNDSSGIVDVPGVTIGHATDLVARTGCTVILFDPPALTAVETRGAAPGTRELDLLAPGRMVQRADAILLSGGSAFGLSSADGVVRSLAKAGLGFPTPAGPVPIVPAAVVFDLAVGSATAPDAAFGEAAVANTLALSRTPEGTVGAGTGATWGNIGGPDSARRGGIGIAQRNIASGSVTAIAVVNAFGIVSSSIDSATDPRITFLENVAGRNDLTPGQATTLVAVITTVACNHDALIRCCVAAHDGMARCIVPAHTLVDGDVAFSSTITEGTITPGDLMRLTIATELAVEFAIRRAVTMNVGPIS